MVGKWTTIRLESKLVQRLAKRKIMSSEPINIVIARMEIYFKRNNIKNESI